MRGFGMAVAALCTLLLSGCGYNQLQSKDEQVKAAWSEVLNQYQRRADLVPNLVNTVKGFAQQEKDVLTQVTAARSRVGSIQATPELVDNPEAFARFQAAQRELGGALSRLLAVAESYPQLKSDANFRDLQAQLEGTENRIAVARNRYRSEEHTSELQSLAYLVCRLLLEKKKKKQTKRLSNANNTKQGTKR